MTEEEKKKLGRPFSEKPKTKTMSFMSDDETNDILEEYIAKKKVSKSVAIRTGIHKLKDELK
ncbi:MULTISPECIES: hypothetical protein [Lactococcus]|uniref:CopG family transcriptional regulator n=4 Tax=Lactococcus TaxID=1357 RepID=A0A896TDG0_LACLC|nr:MULTISPECIES: hypothetical protein [Lactococcus]EQC82891.1 CopG family transcripitonal regulator [Lactococcus cremoris subsp. cremoris TIFN7]EQC93904.1 CopG family transcripitonal regulator [Lactococcus cremoris subsp. cremoris TIFN3]KZK09342.1 hypothetical protein V4_1191 [Lactococcus cremoris]MBU3885327.1 hypothetical protein [Lactococcus lactis]MDM7546166.1 hypothetical protein [Lactococcus lactis]